MPKQLAVVHGMHVTPLRALDQSYETRNKVHLQTMWRHTSIELIYSVVVVLAGVFLVALGDDRPDDFARASSDFAINLLKTQFNEKEGNIVLSPSSIGILLAILQQGAQENTLKQLETVLHMTAEQSRKGHNLTMKSVQRDKVNVTFEWGNKAYIKPGFEILDGFNISIRENFGATIEELNFVEPSPTDAANIINEWVKMTTHDNIKDLVSPSMLTPTTVLILLNAVYFKGLWDVPFNKYFTNQRKFELSLENGIEVPFMSQKERFIAGEDQKTGIMWVDLPFKDEQFSMLFLLPIEKHGLNQVMGNLTGSLLQEIINDKQTRQVTLLLPKFKLNEKVVLSKVLEELGLTDIFTDAANLGGITPSYHELKVSKIIHQAGVEVDENGSTAFSATGIFSEVLSFIKAHDSLTFIADHPFLFFILDRSNNIPLFAGKVADPS